LAKEGSIENGLPEMLHTDFDAGLTGLSPGASRPSKDEAGQQNRKDKRQRNGKKAGRLQSDGLREAF
jgi:hypothetical protein